LPRSSSETSYLSQSGVKLIQLNLVGGKPEEQGSSGDAEPESSSASKSSQEISLPAIREFLMTHRVSLESIEAKLSRKLSGEELVNVMVNKEIHNLIREEPMTSLEKKEEKHGLHAFVKGAVGQVHSRVWTFWKDRYEMIGSDFHHRKVFQGLGIQKSMGTFDAYWRRWTVLVSHYRRQANNMKKFDVEPRSPGGSGSRVPCAPKFKTQCRTRT